MLTQSEKISFIKKVFGPVQKTTGGNVQVVCPYCKQKNEEDGMETVKQKLAIDLLGGERWHCWVCGAKGRSLANVLRRFFSSHLEFYIKNFEVDEKKQKEDEVETDVKVHLPDDYVTIFEGLNRGFYYKRCFEYLTEERGLTPRQIVRWGLGVSREIEWLGRIIMPSFDRNGNVNYLTGRDISGKKKYKYWNSSCSKSNLIHNEIALNFSKELNLVEGPFDLFNAPENSTALLGSSINTSNSKLFSRIVQEGTPVVIALDGNMLETKIPNLAKKFLRYDLEVSIIDHSSLDGEDLGASSKESIKKAFDRKVKWTEEFQAKRRLNTFWKREIL